MDDTEIAVWRRRRRRGMSFGVLYLIVSAVLMAGAVGFLGGFQFGVHKQKTAPTAAVKAK